MLCMGIPIQGTLPTVYRLSKLYRKGEIFLDFFTDSRHREKNFKIFTEVSMSALDLALLDSLGADLRSLRKSRGLTLSDLAEAVNKSVGWLSQVERDLSEPSINDLRDLARALDIPISMLFGQAKAAPEEAGFVVRQGARRPIGSNDAGLVEELLSPDLTDDFEVVHSTFESGTELETPVIRPTQEVGYLISGKLDIRIAGKCFIIQPGDSFRIRGEAFQYSNPYHEPAVAIWVIAPPVY